MRVLTTLHLLVVLLIAAEAQAGDSHTLTATDASGELDDVVTVEILLDIDEDPISGFQYGLCHDPDYLSVEALFAGDAVTDNPVTFAGLREHDDGVTQMVLYDVVVAYELEIGDDYLVAEIEYLIEDDGATETELEFCDDLGAPVVEVSVFVSGADVEPARESGTVLLYIPNQFLRGDVDGNGTVSALVDSLELLTWAFGDGDEPVCLDSADVDDNGSVSALLDALVLLQWAFDDGIEPPSPGVEECGEDPDLDADDVSCSESGDGC